MAPVQANELDLQQLAIALESDPSHDLASAVTLPESSPTPSDEQPAIITPPASDSVSNHADAATVAPTTAITAPPLSPDPTPRTVSKQARDLFGVPLVPTIAQAESATPTETQPTETTPPNPVNNPLIPPSGWRFDVEPYLFVPFKLDGDIFFGRGRRVLFPNRPGEILPTSGFNLNVNAKLSDVTANLTNIFGISSRVQAWNGDFGVVADGLYVNTKFNTSSDGGTLTLRDRVDIPVPGFELDTQTTIASFALAGSYRIVTVPLRTVTDPANPSNYYPAIAIEALAGARYASIFQSVDFDNGPDFEFFGSTVNPMLGGTFKLLLNDKLALYFRGDTSGFGSNPIRQYYNLHAGVDWKFSGSFALRLAYRINEIEFVKEGLLNGDDGLRLRAEGVQLGLAWQF